MNNATTATQTPPLDSVPLHPIVRASFSMTIGIILCGAVRDFLKRCKWEGMDIEWYEGSGWIDREWIVRGKASDVQIVRTTIERWASKSP